MKRLIVLAIAVVGVMGCEDEGSEGVGGLTGKGGSMARFTVNSTHLYTVDDESLNVYQLLENGGVVKINDKFLGFGIETIFATEKELFIGSTSAVYIYDITNGSNPQLLSQYTHILSCDPVVVQDTIAYVTLRSGNACRPTGSSSLDILNVKDLTKPQIIGSYFLESPYGLGVDGNTLFVCEGEKGLKVFNVTNPKNLSIKSIYSSIDAYDVIPNNGVLIVTGKDGIYQYDYSSGNLQLLSHLNVVDNE
jgi:hypothetical protein